MRRRTLICFCILSTDWKPDMQPKIDKTEKQFFKSWWYFFGQSILWSCVVVCPAEALIGYIQTIIFLSSSGPWLKVTRRTLIRENSHRIVIIKYLHGLGVWPNYFPWVVGYALQGLSWMTRFIRKQRIF